MNIDIRQSWLDYYQSLGFKAISSAPLVHPAFPTAFNMSAGLVQLDSRIRSLEKVEPDKECLVQKCIRYFDINKVGDESHLSFFEMTGSFEIVKFDKKQTVTYVWRFLTEKLNIDPQKLWITVFDKDKIVNRTISLPESLKKYLLLLVDGRLVYGGQKTNLWSQEGGVELTDDIRLCGPQVEFFYDRGEDKGCGKKTCNPFCDCGRFLEVSNILFILYYIDYNHKPTLKKLVNPSTEAVIGIERCALVVENKDDIFKTSYFTPLLSVFGKTKLDENIKIIVDHIKSLTFILAEEKVIPERKDRGRIIRTLIRNLLSSFYVLKINPWEYLSLLVDEVIKMYEKSYPGIKNGKKNVLEIVFDHEKTYQKTLDRAKRKIKEYLEENNVTTIGEKEKKYFWAKFGVQEKLIPFIIEKKKE